jgi:hemoglobin-like flavoprotein
MFESLGGSLLGSMQKRLGSEVMNEAAVGAWKKAYGVIIAVINQGLESANTDK